MTSTEIISLWEMGRKRLTNLVLAPDSTAEQPKLLVTETDLAKRIHPDAAGPGWLWRHCAETELFFCDRAFGHAHPYENLTFGPANRDHGQCLNPAELANFWAMAHLIVYGVMQSFGDAKWAEEIDFPPFGRMKRSDAVARMISHTGYHAGQLALALKYGK